MTQKADAARGAWTVPVETKARRYDVHVGCGILGDVGALVANACGGEVAAVVADSNVGPLYGDRVRSSLETAGYEVAQLSFPAGERNKRFSTLEILLEDLAEAQLTRHDVVVALGGGVTGDMAGLAAALYLRGIQVAQVPTSLLAMVDSSVGGKTAVDLAVGKNLAGAFLQPSVVVADVECLHTLSPDLFRDSCGEVIKHGVLADPELFAELAANPLNAPGRDDEERARIVARNVTIKRNVVNADENDRGVRATLNLGHTLGHAIEAASEYALGHGSSVACGLCCVTRATEELGWTKPGTARRIEEVVRAHGLPTDTDLSPKSIARYAVHDKKRRGGAVGLVVVRDIGCVEVINVTLAELERIIRLGCGVS